MLFSATEATQKLTGTSRARLIAEAHERISNALNGFVAPLIGFAALLVGGFSRFGIWRQIMGAIVALIVVQVLTQAGQGAVRGNENAWPLAYVGPAFGLVMAMGLLLIADRPTLLRWRRHRNS
jgi:lipopolysaccharide export system permease protein